MPLSSTFFTESTSEKIVKIGQYSAKIWTKYHSLLFWPTLHASLFVHHDIWRGCSFSVWTFAPTRHRRCCQTKTPTQCYVSLRPSIAKL